MAMFPIKTGFHVVYVHNLFHPVVLSSELISVNEKDL